MNILKENEGAQFKQCHSYWVILAATGCFKGVHKDKAGKFERGDEGIIARAYFNESISGFLLPDGLH